METYFTRLYKRKTKTLLDPAKYSVANNGWIWNADPLSNFALPPSKAYLRREVIVWGDCVKLRYGDSPESNPWLWEHMKTYVTSLAKTFTGFRIDNCHSTPLHVGVYMLDAARVVNPDLYVCAELFTGSEDTDKLFVSRLGLNSLIREAGNAWDPKELSRLLYRHGLGKPIGEHDRIRPLDASLMHHCQSRFNGQRLCDKQGGAAATYRQGPDASVYRDPAQRLGPTRALLRPNARQRDLPVQAVCGGCALYRRPHHVLVLCHRIGQGI